MTAYGRLASRALTSDGELCEIQEGDVLVSGTHDDFEAYARELLEYIETTYDTSFDNKGHVRYERTENGS